MAATLIPVAEVPEYVEGKTGREVSLPTVYNWIKNGYHGTTLPTITINTTRDKGKSKILAVRLDSLKNFIKARFTNKE